jgi:hypothetical protein
MIPPVWYWMLVSKSLLHGFKLSQMWRNDPEGVERVLTITLSNLFLKHHNGQVEVLRDMFRNQVLTLEEVEQELEVESIYDWAPYYVRGLFWCSVDMRDAVYKKVDAKVLHRVSYYIRGTIDRLEIPL